VGECSGEGQNEGGGDSSAIGIVFYLSPVSSVQGGCRGRHWSKRRCCEMQRRELSLDKGKREWEAFWSGLERWVWFGC
jgi:hypothetical protein